MAEQGTDEYFAFLTGAQDDVIDLDYTMSHGDLVFDYSTNSLNVSGVGISDQIKLEHRIIINASRTSF